MFHFRFGLLFAVDEEAACTTGSELTGFIGGELVAHIDFACWQRIARTDGVQFQTEQAIGVLEMAVLHVKRKAAQKAGLGNDHAG